PRAVSWRGIHRPAVLLGAVRLPTRLHIRPVAIELLVLLPELWGVLPDGAELSGGMGSGARVVQGRSGTIAEGRPRPKPPAFPPRTERGDDADLPARKPAGPMLQDFRGLRRVRPSRDPLVARCTRDG